MYMWKFLALLSEMTYYVFAGNMYVYEYDSLLILWVAETWIIFTPCHYPTAYMCYPLDKEE